MKIEHPSIVIIISLNAIRQTRSRSIKRSVRNKKEVGLKNLAIRQIRTALQVTEVWMVPSRLPVVGQGKRVRGQTRRAK